MGKNEEKCPQGELLVYQGQGLNTPIQVRLEGETVWLSQKRMADLFGVAVPTINEHISNIYDEEELLPEATIRKFRIVQTEGSRQVGRLIDHYNLEMIIAVGFRIRSRRGSQFRKWANDRISEYLVKGFTMDDERLKGKTGIVDYFDELLTRIREIRASEARVYPVMFLDQAEFRAQRRQTILMPDWEVLLDKFLADVELPVLENIGSASINRRWTMPIHNTTNLLKNAVSKPNRRPIRTISMT